MKQEFQWIELEGVSQNNLKNISLRLPRNKFIVVTGVSGSGKTSLAFDVINGEGRRKYFVNLSAKARNYLGKLEKPAVDTVRNLTPTIAISQAAGSSNPRSTVGTLSEIYDFLRLLFARLGKSDDDSVEPARSLFSFNSPEGACPHCKGLGVEDRIDPDLLIEDPARSIRERAFKITNPDGYIIYSQVTMEALNEVCKANGFSVDIPWEKLTPEQQDVVLNGSDKVKIPYGKHTLESRMKWTGITAKPREEGYYKGILPVMNQILKRDRNPNILRFAKTVVCPVCRGSRLSQKSLSVKIAGKTISCFASMTLENLQSELKPELFSGNDRLVAVEIINEMHKRLNTLLRIGLGYLTCDRPANTLSAGELQRIRLAKQLDSRLRNITFVFDEPSVGVHPSVNAEIIAIMKQLVANGNTVIAVEHDAQTILSAGWIVEIGPGAGHEGGELLFNGSAEEFFRDSYQSLTKNYLPGGTVSVQMPAITISGAGFFSVKDASINNLKSISVDFAYNRLNVVTGVTGAGKSSLVNQTLIPLINNEYGKQLNATGKPLLENFTFSKTIVVDRSPIGKTARSTPATYTKLYDLIRNLFASLEDSKQRGFGKSFFSFNTPGGRCEKCEGAGKLEVGMHFLGNVETTCDACGGKRYKPEVLEVKFKGLSIADVLELSVKQAYDFFESETKIRKYLKVLVSMGLGYIKLGQSSNTLSGGEAQRIKLATEIVKANTGNNLFVFDEPTTGLHFHDIQVLLDMFAELLNKGNTIIAIEYNEDFIRNAHRIIDIGPFTAEKGGEVVFQGSYDDFVHCENSVTASFLKNAVKRVDYDVAVAAGDNPEGIELKGVTTNNLKSIDVWIPDGKHTVITGKSGSGKSSLAFDTLFAEAQNRFTESFPAYIRQFAGRFSKAEFESVKGLTPVIALKQGNRITDPRSTLGTLTGVFDLYRLLFSRSGIQHCSVCGATLQNGYCNNCRKMFPLMDKASLFSFNNTEGACPHCTGLGTVLTSSAGLMIENPGLSFENGALANHKSLRFYSDPAGQYIATLKVAGKKHGFDFSLPVEELPDAAVDMALFGSGEEEYEVIWNFKRKERTGTHSFKGKWKGFVNLLIDEYHRKHANGKGDDLLAFLTHKPCPVCNGKRFNENVLAVTFAGVNIHTLQDMSVAQSLRFFGSVADNPSAFGLDSGFVLQNSQLFEDITGKLKALEKLGLSYLQINRPSVTLSGGELQRALLSTHLQGGLTGLTYILDEPTTGLHPADTEKLNESIKRLINAGNSVVTVEHNTEVIRRAEYLIELGPGAGQEGGYVVETGSPGDFLKNGTSLTGKYLDATPVILNAKEDACDDKVVVKGAMAHNLKNVDVEFGKECINAVTGVSGSGKTTLVKDVLLASIWAHKAVNCSAITGVENFDEAVWVDKQPASASTVSTPLTFTGVFDHIRKLFASTEQAKVQKLTAAAFSFNGKSGQCPVCKGAGEIKVSLDFINDVTTVCESCNGKRYRSNILQVKYKGKNIYDVLEMTIKEASEFFYGNEKIYKVLTLLDELGLGYLKAGQKLTALSGGELQRLKLAKEIISNKKGRKLYVFDEPSRGLHPEDISGLLRLFDLLVEAGNTVVVVEHNPFVIAAASRVIDLGPGGGEYGGEVIWQGGVQGLLECNQSETGRFLKMK